MTKFVINDQEYELDDMTPEIKAQLASIQFVDQEIGRAQAQVAALQTAKNAYLQALTISLSNLKNKV